MLRPLTALLALLLSLSGSQHPIATDLEPIQANDNRRPAGMLAGRELSLTLELRRGRWLPAATDGPSLEVLAFGEPGQASQIPSPLVRVPEGTRIRATIRNTLADSTLVLHGLHTRPGAADDTIQVRPGAVRTVVFAAGTPGTYYYWGSTTGQPMEVRSGEDSQLGGAFIVDRRGSSPTDRVFVIGNWFEDGDTTVTPAREPRDAMVINGKAWPHTEQLDLRLGEPVRWHWINASANSHPMHLHGFYFHVDSRGDWKQDTAYAPPLRPLEVTELMLPGATMAMRWTPERPGNWIFHCHFAFHVSPFASLGDTAAPGHAAHAMGGLILGIHVAARPGAAAVASPVAARPIRLLVQRAAARAGPPAFGYVMQRGAPPAADSIEIPGPRLVLERGRPVRVTVVNHLAEPTAVHWHGIELESRADGVPDWSGIAPVLMRPITPGDSFVAEFTPPRSGTFIYHAHANELMQLTGGLYGALIVTEPGKPLDERRERIVLVSLNGPSETQNGGLVNGRRDPAAIELAAGVRHRLRLISIDADERILFTLVRDTTPVRWRALAKDGAELPRAQATLRPARLLTGPGETADFELMFPRPGTLALLIQAPYAEKPWTMRVPVLVR